MSQAPLSPRELQSDMDVIDSPLWGGFTIERLRRILETALAYAEKAEKYEKIRASNRRAQKTWRRAAKKKSTNVPRGTPQEGE